MKELRFKVGPGLAGSAAREAEKNERVPSPLQGLSASSARAAEQAKRDAASGSSAARPGFSLRAQNGRVVRTDAGVIHAADPAARDAQHEISEEAQEAAPQPDTTLNSSRTAEARGGSPDHPSAGMLHDLTHRLKNLFRGTASSE